MKLPGISNIYSVRCDSLQPNITLQSLASIPVGIFSQSTSIHFHGTPSCQAEAAYSNGGREEKTVLQFLSCEEIPTDSHLAFLITCADGNSYLIGSKEGPFPTIKATHNTGEPDGDPSGFTYEVTHVSLKSLVPCVM